MAGRRMQTRGATRRRARLRTEFLWVQIPPGLPVLRPLSSAGERLSYTQDRGVRPSQRALAAVVESGDTPG